MIIEIFKQGVLIREIELKGAVPGDIEVAYMVQSKMESYKREQYASKLGAPRRYGQPELREARVRRSYKSDVRKAVEPEPIAEVKHERAPSEYSNMRLYDF